ncbi:MAG: PDDEXK nuclease domain-containing protein [Bacteroidota bacterium]
MKPSIPSSFIRNLKQQILRSRYHAAELVNRELLRLYFNVGKALHLKIEQEKWGAKVLASISAQLQQELPGLRGFSAANLRKMRLFYLAWENDEAICSSLTNKLQVDVIESVIKVMDERIKIFLAISFTHHYEIFATIHRSEDRWFYIQKTAASFWSVRHLRQELRNQSHLKQGGFPNNFQQILEPPLSNQAIQSFKDEYLLDFINIEDPDEEADERLLEHAIVQNIKKFLMSLGNEFSFMGNQYRLEVAEIDYFIDLLFYHRGLQALVAFELKKGKFKPEYAGKMNFYLSALDELIKLPHENPSIGIILCKEKQNKIVEYSFRDLNKPMGVSVFKRSANPPESYKHALPDPETLKKLMD